MHSFRAIFEMVWPRCCWSRNSRSVNSTASRAASRAASSLPRAARALPRSTESREALRHSPPGSHRPLEPPPPLRKPPQFKQGEPRLVHDLTAVGRRNQLTGDVPRHFKEVGKQRQVVAHRRQLLPGVPAVLATGKHLEV